MARANKMGFVSAKKDGRGLTVLQVLYTWFLNGKKNRIDCM